MSLNKNNKAQKTAIILLGIGAALIAATAPAEAREVNLYSERQPFLMKPLLDAFSKATGIKVRMVYLKKGMVERLRAEGANTPADLILTADIGNLHNLAKAGLLQKSSSLVLEANVPAKFRHPDGIWYGLTVRARVIFAHKDRVRPGEVMSYADLAKPHMKGRVCVRSGKHMYNILLLASIIAAEGEAAATQWAKGVKANLARRPQGNDRAQIKAVYHGECDVVLANTYYMGKMATNEKSPVQKKWAASANLIFPNQAGRGAHVNISGAGITKHSKNKAGAIKLIEFLSGNSAQKIYAEGNFEYPVKKGVALHPMVASWGSFKADQAYLSLIAEQRALAAKIMDRVRFNN